MATIGAMRIAYKNLGNLKYEDHVGNLGVGETVSERKLRRTGCEVLGWIQLVQIGPL